MISLHRIVQIFTNNLLPDLLIRFMITKITCGMVVELKNKLNFLFRSSEVNVLKNS